MKEIIIQVAWDGELFGLWTHPEIGEPTLLLQRNNDTVAFLPAATLGECLAIMRSHETESENLYS
jgi:hypothetical protein